MCLGFAILFFGFVMMQFLTDLLCGLYYEFLTAVIFFSTDFLIVFF